jgi:hypothetical protein
LIILFLPNKKATQGFGWLQIFSKLVALLRLLILLMANCYLLAADRLKDSMRLKHKRLKAKSQWPVPAQALLPVTTNARVSQPPTAMFLALGKPQRTAGPARGGCWPLPNTDYQVPITKYQVPIFKAGRMNWIWNTKANG